MKTHGNLWFPLIRLATENPYFGRGVRQLRGDWETDHEKGWLLLIPRFGKIFNVNLWFATLLVGEPVNRRTQEIAGWSYLKEKAQHGGQVGQLGIWKSTQGENLKKVRLPYDAVLSADYRYIIFGKSHTSHHLIKIEHLKPRGQNYPPWILTAGSPKHHQIKIRKIESEPSTSMTTGGSIRWFSRGGTSKILRFSKSISFSGWDGPVLWSREVSESWIASQTMRCFLVGTNPVLLVGCFFTRIYNCGVKVDGKKRVTLCKGAMRNQDYIMGVASHLLSHVIYTDAWSDICISFVRRNGHGSQAMNLLSAELRRWRSEDLATADFNSKSSQIIWSFIDSFFWCLEFSVWFQQMIICSLISWWKLEEQQKHVVDVRHGYVSHNVTETQRVSKSNSVEVALILLMEEILHLLIW